MEKSSQANSGQRWILVGGLIAGLASIVIVLIVISVSELTNRETTLLGTFLTLLSVAMGWGISHFYATSDKEAAISEVREFHQRNLRTYALKAAEKVTNLSKELNRLSSYLQEELQYTGYRNSEEELFAKEERIESAIHLIGSLRSINDTSLSDWQGVIGEELDEQRHTEEQQVEALQELADRISALEVAPAMPSMASAGNEEIDELKRQMRTLAAEISGTGFRPRSRPTYQTIETTCPNCSAQLKYGQRAKENDKKSVQCKACDSSLISTYREATGFVLTVRREKEETLPCPACSIDLSVMLDEWPSASTTVVCPNCSAAARVSRADGGQTIKVGLAQQNRAAEPLTAAVIASVRNALPSQPWPKGVHQTVAASLSLRATTVQKGFVALTVKQLARLC